MELCRKGLHEMTDANTIVNGGRRRCRACWTETRRNIRRLEKVRQPVSFGSSLGEMAKAIESTRERIKILEDAVAKAIESADHTRARLAREDRKVKRLQEELRAASKYHGDLGSLYAKKAAEENAF